MQTDTNHLGTDTLKARFDASVT